MHWHVGLRRQCVGLVGDVSAVGIPTGWDISRPLQLRIFVLSRKALSPYIGDRTYTGLARVGIGIGDSKYRSQNV